MTEKNLSELLEEYAIATQDRSDVKILRQWMDRNPEYAEDLMDFEASRTMLRYAQEDLTENEIVHCREMASRVLERALRELKSSAAFDRSAETATEGVPATAQPDSDAAAEPPKSLTEAASAKGFDKAEFARRIGLSLSLLVKLEKRRIAAATIPAAIIRRIAETLAQKEQAITNYFQLPAVTAGASFKAASRPDELKPESFAEAVRRDQMLSEAERQELLRLE